MQLKDIFSWIFSLIVPDYSSINECAKEKYIGPPSVITFLSKLTPSQLILLIVGTLLTFFICIVGCIQWFYVYRFVSSGKRRSSLYFLISLIPISMLCSLTGMFSPRTAMIVSSLGVEYFLLCLFHIVSLLRQLSGGRTKLIDSLRMESRLINYRSPPICCCLFCLPSASPTEQNIRRLEYAVLQAPIIRGFIIFGQIVVLTETRDQTLGWFPAFDIISMISLMLAIFGVHTLVKLVSDNLSPFGFNIIFRTVDFALMLFTAQHPILFQNILLRFKIIHCDSFLSPQDNARFICNFVTIVELFFLTLLTTKMIKRRDALLDLYNNRSSSIEIHDELNT